MANANLSLALLALEERMDELKANYEANTNAFFMCSMGLIIFCKFLYKSKSKHVLVEMVLKSALSKSKLPNSFNIFIKILK